MENTKKKLRNYAFIEGYLRESYLETGVTKHGVKCIKGEVVVATNRFNSQRVRVFAQETRSDGSENKNYKPLLALLNGTTIASYVSTLQNADEDLDSLDQETWDAATSAATKVWLSGSIEEYATISADENGKEKETSSFSFQAQNGSIRKENDKHKFLPRCNVELDGVILNIRDEMKRVDEDTVETGRVIIDYLWTDYKGIGHKFKLIATDDYIVPDKPESGTFADYIRDNYEVGQTAWFNVAMVNLVETKVTGTKNEGWGQAPQPITSTSFVHELRLFGGRSKTGFGEDSENYIPKDEVTGALAKRRVVAKENYERAQARKNAATAAAPKTEDKGFGASTAEYSDAAASTAGFPADFQF
jgi:hypothetical protein